MMRGVASEIDMDDSTPTTRPEHMTQQHHTYT